MAEQSDITMVCLDAEIASNRDISEVNPEFIRVFDLMNINSLLYAEPAEPYKTILTFFSRHGTDCLLPTDCETRTFLHDIPLVPERSAETICRALAKRKAAIVGSRGIVSYGTVSPEQAFVSFSSVCFSIFVKFFSDVLFHLEGRTGGKTGKNMALLEAYRHVSRLVSAGPPISAFPPSSVPADEDEVYQQLVLTGKALVEQRLVDSYFGNLSYVFNDTIYISQTGSSMDELDTCIDAVPLDGTSSAGITASSELSAHISIHQKTGKRAIVHGHPKFTVIMSMSCRKEGCDTSTCHRSCKEERTVAGVPVVSGEIGTGPTGLVRTVPEAMEGRQAVIVFGHGVFSTDDSCLKPALMQIRSIEETCMREYFAKIQGLI